MARLQVSLLKFQTSCELLTFSENPLKVERFHYELESRLTSIKDVLINYCAATSRQEDLRWRKFIFLKCAILMFSFPIICFVNSEDDESSLKMRTNIARLELFKCLKECFIEID